jgi:hypothetical protein
MKVIGVSGAVVTEAGPHVCGNCRARFDDAFVRVDAASWIESGRPPLHVHCTQCSALVMTWNPNVADDA